MALTLDVQTDETLGLGDFVERLRTGLDVHDEASLATFARPLKMLANNRRFLVDWLNSELADAAGFQRDNPYIAQSLVLARGEGFLVRALAWDAPRGPEEAQQLQRTLFDYQVPHDHNFSLMTVGYLGSGYRTTIYEYDRTPDKADVGAKVALRFLEETSLPAGKVMLYRACRDVHIQAPPTEFSLSVNVMLLPAEVRRVDQYLFDAPTGTIVGFGSSDFARREALCRIACHVADSTTVGHLEAIAARHPAARTRLSAYEAWATIQPQEAARIWSRARADDHPPLRELAERQLQRIDAAATPGRRP
jgi:hypothetical protein